MGKQKAKKDRTREQQFTPVKVMALMTDASEWCVMDEDGNWVATVRRGEAQVIIERGYVFPNLNKRNKPDERVRDFSLHDGVSPLRVHAALAMIRRGSLPSCEDSRTWRRSLNGYEPHFQRCAAYSPKERQLSR